MIIDSGLALLVLAPLAGLASWMLTVQAEKILATRGIVDVPNARSSHDRVVPRGGGVVIVAVGTSTTVVAWMITRSPEVEVGVALVGALALAAIGFVDDRRALSVGLRLAGQVLVSLAFCTVVALGIDAAGAVSVLVVALGAVFVVGSTNIYNFMDGIDGIATLTAVAFGLASAVFGFVSDAPAIMLLGGLTAASSLGFLVHNWSPALIFLGDSGSLYLGFLAASLPLVASAKDPTGILLVGALVPFLVDGVGTILRRWSAGELVTAAHRSHLYQRASRRWGHAGVAGVYGCLAFVSGIVPMILATQSRPLGVFALAGAAAVATALWVAMTRHLADGQ